MLRFCMHLSFLLNLFILYICICIIYKMLVLDVFLVLIRKTNSKSLRIKASAK